MPDPVKPSRLEPRLQSDIVAAPNDIEADCKRAELAARRRAIANGDEAMLSALIHNMAWLRAQRLRINGFLQNGIEDDFELADATARTSEDYDIMVRAKSLPSLVPILRAQICTAHGQYTEALGLFEIHLETALQEGMKRLCADLHADKAWCHLKLGQIIIALIEAQIAESSISPSGQFDDLAMAHCRLTQIYEALGYPEKSAGHKRHAAHA